MKKHIAGILTLIFLFFSLVVPCYAQSTVASLRASCKKNKAAAHKVSVQVGLDYKSNSKELQSKFAQLDTNRFCDCAFGWL